mmetsp:Transcript_705/g.1768  ORF Transcript_705/g.1768 Transcript_705/m.1768 type:complete len:620 (-) Transcript_705:391-2250(-)
MGAPLEAVEAVRHHHRDDDDREADADDGARAQAAAADDGLAVGVHGDGVRVAGLGVARLEVLGGRAGVAVALVAVRALALEERRGGVRQAVQGQLLVMRQLVHARRVLVIVPAAAVVLQARVGQVRLAAVVAGLVVAGAALAGAVVAEVLRAEVAALVHVEAHRLASAHVAGHPAVAALALVRIKGVDALGLAALVALHQLVGRALVGADVAGLALVGGDVGVVAHWRLLVLGEAGAQAAQDLVPAQRAAVLLPVDADRRQDGHLRDVVRADLRILLRLQQRVVHVGVGVADALAQRRHAGAGVPRRRLPVDVARHLVVQLREDALRARLVVHVVRHLALLREAVHVVPPQPGLARRLGELEHAQLAQVLQDDVLAVVALVHVVLGVGATVAAAVDALRLALRAVLKARRADPDEVVRLKVRHVLLVHLLRDRRKLLDELLLGVAVGAAGVVAVGPKLPPDRLRARQQVAPAHLHHERLVLKARVLAGVRIRQQPLEHVAILLHDEGGRDGEVADVRLGLVVVRAVHGREAVLVVGDDDGLGAHLLRVEGLQRELARVAAVGAAVQQHDGAVADVARVRDAVQGLPGGRHGRHRFLKVAAAVGAVYAPLVLGSALLLTD